MHSFMVDTITRQRPGNQESRGSQIPDWENAQSLEIRNCSVQPANTGLDQNGRVGGIVEGLTVYAPVADVKPGDRIIWNGEPYAIDGVPQIWKSPTGRISNMQLRLKRWDG